MDNNISRVNIIQINLQHAKASSTLLAADLARLHTPLALIQEPYVHNGKVLGLEQASNSDLIYDSNHNRPRVCIAIDKTLVFHVLPQFTNQDLVAVKVKFSHLAVDFYGVVVSLYLPFEHNDPVSDSLKLLIDYCSDHNLPLFIGCDANAHNTVWGSTNTNSRGIKLLEFIVANNLLLLNNGDDPTFVTTQRSEVIDLSIVSQRAARYASNWYVSPEESLSDHRRIHFEISNPTIVLEEFRNPRKVDYLSFNIELCKSLDQLDSFTKDLQPSTPHLDNLASNLQSSLHSALAASCPLSKPKSNKLSKSWWSKELSKLKTECRTALRRAKRLPVDHSQCVERWCFYREKRREYKKAINDAKAVSWQNFCTDTNSLSATAKLHKLLCKDGTNKLTWLKNPNGEKSQSPAETLSILLDEHFAHSTNLSSCNDILSPTMSSTCENAVLSNADLSLIDSLVTHEKIYVSLNSFSPFKSPGMDEIFPVVIQKSLYLIIDILQYLYYHCLRLAHIPEPWRHIKVIFIPKAGKRSYHDAKSFRPISLSSYFLKGLERLIDWHIRSDCLVKQPINCSQHAYLTSKSTDTALNNLVTKVEKARLKNLHVLCCFIDIQGAFDHTSPLVVRRALQRHGVSTPITQWIYNMLKCRFIHSQLSDQSSIRKVNSGCPQGGVISPILWNLVVNELLEILISTGIWAQGYADDIVVCTIGREIQTASELMQNALSKIENWCHRVGLTVNPNKAELLLFTNKRKYSFSPIKLFQTCVPLCSNVKYLGVHIDNKLSWRFHVESKINKCSGLLLQCKRVVGSKWGVHPKYLIWIYNAIIKPIFLHGVIVWWKFAQSENNQKYISRLNRLASLTLSNCFFTTSTAALERLLDITPLHILMQSTAASTCYRLIVNNLWESKHVQGHNEIYQFLTSSIPQVLMPSDSIPRCLSFGMTNVKFVIPDREQWLEQRVDTNYDVNIFTDGSRNDLGVGAGVFISSKNDFPFKKDVEDFQCLGNTVTVFQAEITAISNALLLVDHLEGFNVAFYVDSQSVILTLKSNIHTSKTALSCRIQLASFSHRNNVTVIWVPGHSGIFGNEQADLLANTGSAHDFYGPEPALPISTSIIKQGIKEWINDSKELYWRNIKYANHTKTFIKELNINFDAPLICFERSMIRNILAVITGHGPFKVHLQKLKLAEETDCPKCGQDSDTSLHYITTCHYYREARKRTFGLTVLKGATKPSCINVSDLVRFIRVSGRFDQGC